MLECHIVEILIIFNKYQNMSVDPKDTSLVNPLNRHSSVAEIQSQTFQASRASVMRHMTKKQSKHLKENDKNKKNDLALAQEFKDNPFIRKKITIRMNNILRKAQSLNDKQFSQIENAEECQEQMLTLKNMAIKSQSKDLQMMEMLKFIIKANTVQS